MYRRRFAATALAIALALAAQLPRPVLAASTVTADPASLTFGSVVVGASGVDQSVTLSGDGVYVAQVTITGPNASDFSIASDDCSSSNLTGSRTCTVRVTFSPQARGTRSAALEITDDQVDSPQTVPMTGTGVAPVGSVIPLSIDFGTVEVGTTSGHRTVTVSNTGDIGQTLVISNETIMGVNPSDFAFASDTCVTRVIAPGASCTIDLTFTPGDAGARSATMTISDNGLGSPHTVSLAGTGVAPVGSVTPVSIDFGTVTVGTTSAHRTATLTNTGDSGENLLLTSETITGANAADFAFAGATCITSPVAPGTSCTIDLTFSPGAVGAQSATLTISDNGLGSPHTVSLAGTGGTPSADLAVSISAAPNPVKTGQKVTYTITLLNAGPSAATSILINDSLSSQSTFVSVTITGGTCVTPRVGASGVVSCSLASLASGATQPIQIVVTVIAKKSSITNTVTVSAATADPNVANNTASITTRIK